MLSANNRGESAIGKILGVPSETRTNPGFICPIPYAGERLQNARSTTINQPDLGAQSLRLVHPATERPLSVKEPGPAATANSLPSPKKTLTIQPFLSR